MLWYVCVFSMFSIKVSRFFLFFSRWFFRGGLFLCFFVYFLSLYSVGLGERVWSGVKGKSGGKGILCS